MAQHIAGADASKAVRTLQRPLERQISSLECCFCLATMISLTRCQCIHREKENFLQPANEDFQEFLVPSCLGKESELERIQFPLPGSGYSSESAGDALENEQYFWKEEDFPFLQDRSKLDRNEYSYCTRVDGEIACELLQGKGFGIGANLIYKKLDGMWYLVYLEKANI